MTNVNAFSTFQETRPGYHSAFGLSRSRLLLHERLTFAFSPEVKNEDSKGPEWVMKKIPLLFQALNLSFSLIVIVVHCLKFTNTGVAKPEILKTLPNVGSVKASNCNQLLKFFLSVSFKTP